MSTNEKWTLGILEAFLVIALALTPVAGNLAQELKNPATPHLSGAVIPANPPPRIKAEAVTGSS